MNSDQKNYELISKERIQTIVCFAASLDDFPFFECISLCTPIRVARFPVFCCNYTCIKYKYPRSFRFSNTITKMHFKHINILPHV